MKKTGGRKVLLAVMPSVFGVFLFFVPMVFAADITVQPDESVFIQIVNFILLVVILNIVLYKPIRRILSQRKEIIEGIENGIQTCLADMEDKGRAYNEGIKHARIRGIAEKDVRIAEARAEEKKIIDGLNAKALVDMKEIQEKISLQIDAIREKLDRETENFAKAIGEKILGRTV